MKNKEITEKEFAVIKELSDNDGRNPDQRVIAERTGISLGLTNIIIKRLIRMGYIKAKQLNRRKIQYILTPKGFSEKARKSYKYTLKTITLLKSIRQKIRELILSEYGKGKREFVITGNGELADIIEIVLGIEDLPSMKFMRSAGARNGKANGQRICLHTESNRYNGQKKGNGSRNTINVVDYLVESGICL